MSTHWGFVCRTHNPPLISEAWLNHGQVLLIDCHRKVRSGEWARHEWNGFPEVGGMRGPAEWADEHRNCDVALRNEYGDIQEIPVEIESDRVQVLMLAAYMAGWRQAKHYPNTNLPDEITAHPVEGVIRSRIGTSVTEVSAVERK